MNGTLTSKGYLRLWVLAVLVAGAAFLLSVCVGPDILSRRMHFGWPMGVQGPVGDAGAAFTNFMEVRGYRVLAAAVVGFALGAAGVTLQALLRNPLADPYVLGISSGASVGVMFWLMVSAVALGIPAVATSATWRGVLHYGATVPAVVGAILTCVIVFALARRRGGGGGAELDPLTLLLVGVIVSAINGSVLMLMNSIVPHGLREDLMAYMLGTVSNNVDALLLGLAGAALLAGYVPVLLAGRALNVGSLSDAESTSLGVNVRRLRAMCFVCASIMTAAAIALAGPIGFVGLICPHVCRMIFGADHRKLIVAAPFCGAALLMLADSFVRSTLGTFNGELPVGVVTALAGGPFFMVLLKRRGS